MSFLHLAIVLPFIVALLIPLFLPVDQTSSYWLVSTSNSSDFVYLLLNIYPKNDGRGNDCFNALDSATGINFTVVVDGLSLLFALLITGIGSLVTFYSIYYLGKKKERLSNFYTFLFIFMTAMLGVVLSDNLIVLYLFWELTSISSFLLIGYWYHRERSRYGARKSMMITVFGGLMMLGGFILLHIMSDSFSIREIISNADVISNNSLFIPAMILILLGAFYEICASSIPYLVARCDGSTYSGQCLPPLCYDGKSWDLYCRSVHATICKFGCMVLDGITRWDYDPFLGFT